MPSQCLQSDRRSIIRKSLREVVWRLEPFDRWLPRSIRPDNASLTGCHRNAVGACVVGDSPIPIHGATGGCVADGRKSATAHVKQALCAYLAITYTSSVTDRKWGGKIRREGR